MSEMPGKLFGWLNSRLPILNTYERHLSKHPVPSKVNFWYLFGALASVVLIIQIISGIWLIMPYAYDRGFNVFCSSLSSYVQRSFIWLISEA